MSRTDDMTLARLWRTGEVLKWALLTQMVVICGLAANNYVISRKPIQTVAVLPSGEALNTGSVSEELRRNMALHDTREFLEALHSRDAVLGPTARKKAVWYMAPNLAKQIEKQVADSILLMNMVAAGAQSNIEWDIPPKVVSWNYPGVRIFGAFQVVTRTKDGLVERVKHNITVDGTFFASTEARPSGYLITRFMYVTDTRDLDNILNKIGG